MKYFIHLLLLFGFLDLTFAQDLDETGFGEDFTETDDSSFPDESSPNAESDDENETNDLSQPTDPAVIGIIESNPTTPAEQLRAVRLLVQLNQLELAKRYLEMIQKAQLNQATLVELQNQFGADLLFRLTRIPELNPAAKDLAARVLTAVKSHRSDSKRIQSLVAALTKSMDSQSNRLRLASELIQCGEYAVGPIMNKLANTEDDRTSRFLRSVIVKIGSDARNPLVGFLQSSDSKLRSESLIVLMGIRSSAALPYLIRPFLNPVHPGESKIAGMAIRHISGAAPNDSAVEVLRNQASRAYAGKISGDLTRDREVWIWDDDQREIVKATVTTKQYASIVASRLYRDLVSLNPENPKNTIRELVSRLEADKSIGGLDQPLRTGKGSASALAESMGATKTEIALQTAISDGHLAAAAACAEVLGKIGSQDLLNSNDGQPRVLPLALRHKDARIRIHAALAIMEIGVKSPFPGIDELANVLGFAASSAGKRRALVAHPRRDIGQTFVGLLHEMGYDAELVSTSKTVVKASTRTNDFEFLLISDAFIKPETNLIVQELRKDPRTKDIPVGLLSRDLTHRRTARFANLESSVISLPELTDKDALAKHVSLLLGLTNFQQIPSDKRLDYAALALDALVDLAAESNLGIEINRQYDHLEYVIYHPQLSPRAAAILSYMPNAQAQSALIGIANSQNFSRSNRDAATKAFAESVERFGILLTNQALRNQIRLWQTAIVTDSNAVIESALKTLELKLTN